MQHRTTASTKCITPADGLSWRLSPLRGQGSQVSLRSSAGLRKSRGRKQSSISSVPLCTREAEREHTTTSSGNACRAARVSGNGGAPTLSRVPGARALESSRTHSRCWPCLAASWGSSLNHHESGSRTDSWAGSFHPDKSVTEPGRGHQHLICEPEDGEGGTLFG